MVTRLPLRDVLPDSVYPENGSIGVYGIISKSTGKLYIGSSSNLRQRFKLHTSSVRTGNWTNRLLHSAMVINPQDFEFVVIEELKNKGDLLKKEKFWMDFYNSYDLERGYNLHSNPTQNGFKHPEESVKKRAAASKGRILLSRRRPIVQCDESGIEIAIYATRTEARLAVRCGHASIDRSLLSHGSDWKAYSGYKWKYRQ